MNIDHLLPWMVFANTAITLFTAVYAGLTAGAKKATTDLAAYKKSNGEQLAVLEQKASDHGSRIQSLEDAMQHLPDRDMVHGLQLTLKDIQIEMATMRALTEQATRTSQRVEGWLLKRAEEPGK